MLFCWSLASGLSGLEVRITFTASVWLLEHLLCKFYPNKGWEKKMTTLLSKAFKKASGICDRFNTRILALS
jgi:hypothetical protein